MKIIKLFSVALLLLQCYFLQAQSDLQNTGTMYVSSATDTLFINGNFTNTAAAAFTNKGMFYVRQNLTNGQSAMAVGTGTLYLTGASTQIVAGTQTFKTLNLVTNSAGITLNSNLDVSGAHTFTAGIITTSATPNYLIYEAGASYSGDGDNMHVNGWVKKFGNTNFVFPVGNTTVERTVALQNLSASSEFNAQYVSPTTNTGNLAAPIMAVIPSEYWVINQVSGGTAKVNLNWDNSKVATPPLSLADLVAASYVTGNWTSQGGSPVGTPYAGNVTSNTMSAFGSFVVGAITTPLPLSFTSFTGQRKNDYTDLHWSTVNEINTAHFDVQRSNDGTNFNTIGQVSSRNLVTLQEYVYQDHLPLQGTVYYRIRSVDKDGKSQLTKIIAVSDAAFGSAGYFAIANPAHDEIRIKAGAGHTGDYTYRLLTATGQLIQQGILTIHNGGNYSIHLTGTVIPGIYTIDIYTPGFSSRQKILVQ